ncbi:PilZ domain-containing protein [Nitratireductor aestuarii]|nr:PilZ domain-containing protein [Nitratireductor aestuarii]
MEATKERNVLETVAGDFQRVPVSVQGRYMLEDMSEHRCRVTAMSPGDAVLTAGHPGSLGEQIIAYIDHIGRVEGMVLSVDADSFVMSINASERKRDKLAAQLTWLANRHELDLADDRRHDRLVPANPHSFFVTSDGARHPCYIIDVSVSGAALRCEVRPDIGTDVSLSSIPARVARHIPEGVAVSFLTLQDLAVINAVFLQ